MSDLQILESIIAILLFMYIVRPFVRRFRGVDGLSALPGIALLLVVAIIPSFGFRPELLPLALFAFFSFLVSIPRLADIARHLRTDDYGERQPFAALAFAVLLIASYVFVIVFSPIERIRAESISVERIEAEDAARGVAVTLLFEKGVAAENAGPAPLLIFGPPVLGSSGLTRTYRAELAAQGFAVLTYFRPGFDFPSEDPNGRIRLPRLEMVIDSLAALFLGNKFAFAAEAGARLERERAEDLKFTVEYVRSMIAAGDEHLKNVDCTRISIAGYGASGAAALLYASQADPTFIKSIVAIEAPVNSFLALEAKSADTDASPNTSSTSVLDSVGLFFAKAKKALRIRKVLGPIRGADAYPGSEIPTMLLVSDWIRDMSYRDERYAVLVRYLRSQKNACSIVSVAGAGPLHFSDSPIDYPVYTFFARGKDRFIPRDTPFAEQAATITESFILGTLESGKPVTGVLIEKNN